MSSMGFGALGSRAAFAGALAELCIGWMWSPLRGHKQWKSEGLEDTIFPEATGDRGRWNLGLKQEEQQRQMRQVERRQQQGIPSS